MRERVQLLDLSVDILSTRESGNMTLQFLEEEGSRVVYFVNSETLLLQKSNPDMKKYVEDCELVLPANVSVSESIDRVLGHKRESFFLESYLDIVLDYAVERGYELLLVAESEKNFISIQENLHEKRPYLTLSGIYLTEKEETPDHIVNEINSVAPDILLVALPETQQMQLLMEYRNQINAELMIFSGNVLYHQAVSELEVPKSIQKLRFDNIYKWFHATGKIKTFWSNIIMKIQLMFNKKGNKED